MLAGKIAWVTGASGGIGSAVAQLFAREGACLVLAGREQGKLESLMESLPNLSEREHLVLSYDILDSNAISAAFQRHFKELRTLDVMVNNAGVMLDAPLGMVGKKAIDVTLQVNVVAALMHTQYAAKVMSKVGGGSIINVSSIIGMRGNANQALYAASKAAVVGLTLSAAKELASSGVRVNAIAPGFISTAMTDSYPEDLRAATVAKIGQGRPGRAEEVAKAALFFASDLSSYVTGQVLGVDGGMVI